MIVWYRIANWKQILNLFDSSNEGEFESDTYAAVVAVATHIIRLTISSVRDGLIVL